MRFAGEMAALGTAACWAVGSNLFAAAGRRMGVRTLNQLRISTALVFLGLALFATRGTPWPVWATRPQIVLLAASGLIGFVFGDTQYFRALVILGPSRAALLASLAPLFTAALAWPVLHEAPGPAALLGMAMTLGGVCWVLRARGGGDTHLASSSALAGVIAGVLGAIGQAGGYVISKIALQSGLDPLSATVVRVAAATIGMWLFTGDRGRAFEALRDRRGALFMLGGAFCGPFLGVTLSLTALKLIEAGVAASLTAVFPLFTMLIAARFHGERLTLRSMGGTLLAVAGVVVLFTR